MAKSKSPETILRNSILEWLWVRYPMIQVWAQKNQGTYDPRRGIFRRSTKHFKTGVSDLIGIFPNGIWLAIECKIKPRRATKEQIEFLQMIGDRGGVGILAYSVDDVDDLLDKAVKLTPQLLQGPGLSFQALSSLVPLLRDEMT